MALQYLAERRYFKKLGLWFYEDMHEVLSGMAMATFIGPLKMSREVVEVFLVDVRKDLNEKRIHAYLPL
jgi:hypothetical protein